MSKENEIGFVIRKLSNLIRRDIDKSKTRLGIDKISGINGWAIDYFYENRGKDIFQKDFENNFSIRSSTASKILKTMEQKGFIERVSVESDARLRKIILTEKAVELHENVIKEIKDREKRLRNGVSNEEINTFFSVIEKFTANMENEYD